MVPSCTYERTKGPTCGRMGRKAAIREAFETMDFPITSADQRVFSRGYALRPNASVMDCRQQRAASMLTRRLFGTNSVGYERYFGYPLQRSCRRITVILSLTCTCWTEPEHLSHITFQPPLLRLLSIARSVMIAMFCRHVLSSKAKSKLLFRKSIHQVSPPVGFFPIANLSGVPFDHIVHNVYV